MTAQRCSPSRTYSSGLQTRSALVVLGSSSIWLAPFFGFATLNHSEGGLELEDLFVDPDRMRTGVGTLLVADAAELAASSGHTSIDVTANPHAAEFYTAVGFMTVGVEETMFEAASRLRLVVTPSG